MKNNGGMQRLFAVSVYERTKDGDFTGKRRVSASTGEVSARVIQADAALRGILAALRAMREICAICEGRDMSPEETAARNGELDSLKEEISRLSKQALGVEFMSFMRTGGRAGAELRKIDEAIGRISEYCESAPESQEDRLSDWMRELLGN